MKRHIVPPSIIDFDTRVFTLEDAKDGWEPSVRRVHEENRESLLQSLKYEFGPENFETKIQNFKELGAAPMSIISYHNIFLHQARRAFILELYYPSLIAACALGERILNHLLLDLRSEFEQTEDYKRIKDQGQFRNWDHCINILKRWGVLTPAAEREFRKLWSLRNRSLHFAIGTAHNVRADALAALTHLREIIRSQFSGFGVAPWFIGGIKGACFIARSYELSPFIRKYYLPACPPVGIKHAYAVKEDGWRLYDFADYGSAEMTDEEYCHQYNTRDTANLAPTEEPSPPGVVCFQWKLSSL